MPRPEPDGDEPAAGGAQGDRVPLAALAMPDNDNGDEMANPEVGDHVSYTIEGTVTGISGDYATIKRESVNGQPCEAEPAGAPEDLGEADDRGERADLGRLAGGME